MTASHLFLRRLGSSIAAVLAATAATAAPLSVTDGNAAITVDPASVYGLSSFTVNGTEQLFEQWFWYRLEGQSYEAPLHTLALTGSTSAGNRIDLSYAGGALAVDLAYTLNGGAAGERNAELRENVTLRNTGTVPLVLSLFMEADFDLGGFGGQDRLSGGAAGVRQTDGSMDLRVSSSLLPTAYQAGSFGELFLSLNDFGTTELNDSGLPFGPGDGSFAFQWDLTLHAGEVLSFDIDKFFVPEPGSLPLLALGLAALGATSGRRRISASLHPWCRRSCRQRRPGPG